MKPIIKYIGGKQKEIDNFKQYIPKEFNTYYEPFVGGGAVYWYLEPNNAVISDTNKKLIDFYLSIKVNYYNFIEEIHDFSQIFNTLTKQEQSEMYYKIRDMYNNKIPKEYSNTLIYYFINKMAYCGIQRVNKKGEFNVPYGRYEKINYEQVITEEHHKLLNHTVIKHCDFNDIFDIASKDDFMFLDPPYDDVFNNYGNNDKFDRAKHVELYQRFTSTDCKCLVVIGKTDFTEQLYYDYIVGEYDKKYAVNGRTNKNSKHLVCANFYC